MKRTEGLPLTQGKWVEDRDRSGALLGWLEMFEAELWEERRVAHWKMMRAAWERYNELVAAHEAQGFNGRNPFE